MKRIIRLTESDLARIVRRVISEGFAQNTVLEFDSVTGYKSALFPQLQYKKNGTAWDVNFAGSKTLGNLMNMRDGSFQVVNTEADPTSLDQRVAFGVFLNTTPKTRAEVETAVKAVVQGGYKDPFTIKAGGKTKNAKGVLVPWGRPGFTAGSEMTDAICKLYNVTA
jgi:hypothetical protein